MLLLASCAFGAPAGENHEAYDVDMLRIHPECPDSEPSARLVAANVLLRTEPDEEEEEEDEGGGHANDNDDDADDGYSE